VRRFFRVLAHEWRCLWLSPASYVAGVLFLLLLGLLYWAILRGFTLLPQEQTPATQFFRLFWIPVFFVVPLLTMRGFAEERRTGMLERTLTTTVRPVQLVLANSGRSTGSTSSSGRPPSSSRGSPCREPPWKPGAACSTTSPRSGEGCSSSR